MPRYYLKKVFDKDGNYISEAERVVRIYQTDPSTQAKHNKEVRGTTALGREKVLKIAKHSNEVFQTTGGSIFRITKIPD